MKTANPIKTKKQKEHKIKEKKTGYSNTWFALASHLLFLLSEKIILERDPPPHILANSSHIF
jgi:cytochrome oxidase assembly protein ShyY1